MLVEKEAKRNRSIYIVGVIGFIVITCLLMGMWWVMVLKYAVDPSFFAAVIISVIFAYWLAWELRGKASNSIGLQIAKMTKAEALMFVAAIADHLRDECETAVDYHVSPAPKIEEKRK